MLFEDIKDNPSTLSSHIDTTELKYQLALSLLPRVGFKIWHEAIKVCNSAKDLYSNPSILKKYKVLSWLYDYVLRQDGLTTAEKILLSHARVNVEVISYFADTYPHRLRHISDPPCFVYKRGGDLNTLRMISIVGTREASQYGKDVVAGIVKGLRTYDVTIISGLAYGIDAIAHRESLRNGICTVGIIAGGIDKLYPNSHKPLCEDMIKAGGAVATESPLGVTPENYLFPRRNRIIAGCSDAVLIVEAGLKSGALITGVCANDYDREVLAIPGDVYRTTSEGCNAMIKYNKAHLVTCAEDIAEIMNWTRNKTEEEKTDHTTQVSLQGQEKIIFDIIKDNPKIHVDTIAERSNITDYKLANILLQLELDNLIDLLPGDKYKIHNQ
ncbi:MAG: DNA-processing protein DprA [Cytophagales bacterium]|nr:DNA-processing protein DprA [Cytophagales bacterium]